jgi:regulatory protein YycH of two-component signal transduction system YycFG
MMSVKKYLLTLLVLFNLVFTWGIFGPTEIFFANYIDWLKINANIVKEVIEDNSPKAREGAKPHR